MRGKREQESGKIKYRRKRCRDYVSRWKVGVERKREEVRNRKNERTERRKVGRWEKEERRELELGGWRKKKGKVSRLRWKMEKRGLNLRETDDKREKNG